MTSKPEKRVLVLSATEFELATIPSHSDIVFRFHPAEESAGLIEELDISFRVSATEARRLARALIDMADELQGTPS